MEHAVKKPFPMDGGSSPTTEECGGCQKAVHDGGWVLAMVVGHDFRQRAVVIGRRPSTANTSRQFDVVVNRGLLSSLEGRGQRRWAVVVDKGRQPLADSRGRPSFVVEDGE